MRTAFSATALAALLSLCISCSKDPGSQTVPPPVNPPAATDTTPQTNYDITSLDNCILFITVPEVVSMQRQEYTELSGIAASQVNAGVLYVHEDNANSKIILTNANGDDLGRLVLDNINLRDVEDICVGPGPDTAKRYIYLADIGDNNGGYSSVSVYRFQEPVLIGHSAQTEVHITAIDKIELSYPKSPVNAETLLIDPLTKDLYVASKETSRSTLYTAPYPQSTTAVIKLTAVIKTNLDLLTSGNISADGAEILLRNKGQIWYWKRSANQSIAQTILTPPQTAPYSGNEHQGEGICFAANGGGYYTNTEIQGHTGATSTISFYKRK